MVNRFDQISHNVVHIRIYRIRVHYRENLKPINSHKFKSNVTIPLFQVVLKNDDFIVYTLRIVTLDRSFRFTSTTISVTTPPLELENSNEIGVVSPKTNKNEGK